MSVLEEVLEEERERSEKLCLHIERELATLPKGSVRVRTIRGRTYYYLTHREGDKVKTDYIPASELESVQAGVARRRELAAALKEKKRALKQIDRALGRKPHVD